MPSWSSVVGADGRPLGVVTGQDLLAVYTGGEAATVAELMHEPLTVHPDASLRDAADLLLTHEVHRVLVFDPGADDAMPLGILSTTDVVVEMAESHSAWRD